MAEMTHQGILPNTVATQPWSLTLKEIIHVATIDKRQTNWNSNIMEKEGFIQTVDKLTQEIKVVEFCTDAHVQIGALLNPDKGRYKDLKIHHSLDMWHGAKNLCKKIATVKGQSILLHWLRDIVNHFWWCCKTAETFEQFLALWIGVVHHVCNNHTWETGSCQHDHLEDTQDKEWIERDSKSHKALVEIVLNKRWQKDVHKYLRFRSTAHLESFQNPASARPSLPECMTRELCSQPWTTISTGNDRHTGRLRANN
ncbi:uncharacterized protein LOC120476267 isoform X2 [Pimephales promelas]|uniref:uncharacterized protein LOC120476267 isoform X2 n=1 Tax=Pimephales promelas TaxID=90988 RepID=UPI001955A9E6|nr:uncharacterized protein LOC120476267 isoform X2 [Pimephales promelas]